MRICPPEIGDGAQPVSGGGSRGETGGRTKGGATNDGIGDLEFSGEFASSFTSSYPSQQVARTMTSRETKGNSVDDIEIHRYRANSLAISGSILNGDNTEYGRRFPSRTTGYLLGFPANRCVGGDFSTVLEVAYVG